MHYSKLMMVGLVAPTLVVGACNKRPESREGAVRTEATQTADEAAKGQQERADDISRLDKRVAEIEREYQKANEKVVADKKTPTEGLKAELKEDVINVKEAVNDLRTTTPENWWNRHEEAMRRTADRWSTRRSLCRAGWRGFAYRPPAPASRGSARESAAGTPAATGCPSPPGGTRRQWTGWSC